ncbi:MAG: thioredoxin-disulfide reductase [Candidatus Schekmanbacteria bacterium]|nr:MAG: thioredoxin-disulfide reductase [Candidatus Schekmanbacteria bacterium]
MPDIVIYTLDNCPYCKKAKELIESKGVSYKELNVTNDDALEEEMKERSGRTTLPQIFIDGKHIGGFDDLSELDSKGELDKILGIERKAGGERKTKVLIVGSGPAGLTAAIYCGRGNLSPIVLTGREPGGQLTTTTEVENYPGFVEGIMGPELVEIMKKQAERFGAEFINKEMTDIDINQRPFKVFAEDMTIYAETVIIASGASARFLGLDSEKELLGYGVSTCATCDAFFYRDKEVVVVGGGDSALEEALVLTKFAKKVYVIHRRDKLRASKIMQDKAFKNEKISFIWDSVVEDILGEKQSGVKAVRVKNVKTNSVSEIRCDGVFIAIGHIPNTAVWKGKIELDKAGYVVVRNGTSTSVKGIFAAGDVQDHTYRQAVTAAGSGCMAALDAERFLEMSEEN